MTSVSPDETCRLARQPMFVRMPSRKRTRPKSVEADKKAYYDRLLYKCKKDLHKQAKQCRTMECQKLIRKMKESGAPKDQELQILKNFDLDLIVQEALNRLGIERLDPAPEASFRGANKDEKAPKRKEEAEVTPIPMMEEQIKEWLARLLIHKKMRDMLEAWNGQVTDFTKWCARQDDDGGNKAVRSKSSSKRKTVPAADLASSVFVQLGDARADTTQDDVPVKRNRPGQRARQARAAAIQAKKEGRVVRKSLNWRSKPIERDDQQQPSHHKDGTKNQPEDQEALHPSWAARKTKKDGIVQFKGKKITFD